MHSVGADNFWSVKSGNSTILAAVVNSGKPLRLSFVRLRNVIDFKTLSSLIFDSLINLISRSLCIDSSRKEISHVHEANGYCGG